MKKRIAANIQTSEQSASSRTAESMRVEATESVAALFGRKALETRHKGRNVPKNFLVVIWQ